MTVSNGTWNPAGVNVGVNNGSRGVLTIAGGTNILIGNVPMLLIAQSSGSTGIVWVTGGQLLLTNALTEIDIGESGAGTFIQSNGTVRTYEEIVGSTSGSPGNWWWPAALISVAHSSSVKSAAPPARPPSVADS